MTAKVALVGPGYWGKNLVRNFNELGALYAICESNPANPVLAQYPNARIVADYDALLADPAVDAVALATPAEMHALMARRALLAGKDVYVEKPLALTVPEAEELVALAAKQGRILMVGHILQYHPAVLKLRAMIQAGELGHVEYVYSNRLNIGKLRTEENILWSFAPHDISTILMLLGQEPLRVACTGGDYLSKGIVDTTVTTLEFDKGVKGHIFVSWLHPFKEQKLVVIGSKAMVVFDDVSAEKLFLYPHSISWAEGKVPVANKADKVVVPFEKAEPLKAECAHFLECIASRTAPRTDGREGLRVLRVLAASEESLAAGGRPVPMAAATAAPVQPSVFIHETAIIDDGVTLGAGTKVWHFTHVLKNSTLGERCVVGQNVTIGPGVTIGNGCKIQNNISVYTGVTLEDEVFCGPSCVFTNVYNPRAFIERKSEFLPTLVKRGATIGANSTIVCGNTIGSYAMIGAGAVVKRNVPDHAVMAGVPARQVGWACRCGTTLRFAGSDAVSSNDAVCTYCGEGYAKTDSGVRITAPRKG
jgi:UDP-2-acetamido-3-amino-2,3-dideoxy-glucuronate N-acetyltransferase